MKKNFAVSLLASAQLALPLIAGPLNVANLSPGDIYKFTVAADGESQDFILAFGQASGTFFLPDKVAVLTAEAPEKPTIEIPPGEEPRIVLLHKEDEALKFIITDSKPSPEKWTYRILNLSPQAVTIRHKKESLEIPPGAEITPKISGRNDIHLTTPDETRHSLPKQETEPTATMAVILPSEDGWTVTFIMDR